MPWRDQDDKLAYILSLFDVCIFKFVDSASLWIQRTLDVKSLKYAIFFTQLLQSLLFAKAISFPMSHSLDAFGLSIDAKATKFWTHWYVA